MTVAALLAAVAALVACTMVSAAPPAQALAKIKCKQTTGTADLDPIVHHNEPAKGSAHMHQFFGNNGWLSLPNPNAANLSDLVGQGTNCANKSDTAGYWTPVLQYKASGQTIPTQAFTAYYRSWDFKDTGQGLPFPADTRLVGTRYSWTCGQFEPQPPVPAIPNCSSATGRPGSTLTAHIDFPSCWNGVVPKHSPSQMGNTSDSASYAYRGSAGCPAAFPVKVVALRETIQFAYTGAGTDVELSSDHEHGTTDGMSLHGDFWNSWNPAGLASMVRNCVSGLGQSTVAECG